MIPSHQFHPWLNSFFILVLFHFYHTTGVGVARFTIVNRCSQPIWPVVQENETQETYDEVTIGSTITFQRPYEWSGKVWAKTGCVFNELGNASCATGDPTSFTLAEFYGSLPSTMGFYVSLVQGFNLPLLITPSGGGGSSCNSTGCTEDVNQRCPLQLRTEGGASCQGPCSAFGTEEYCCRLGRESCAPTNYSRVFKEACPSAYSYPYDDDATGLFICTDADYSITFCSPYNSLLAPAPAPAHNNPQQTKGKNRAKEIVTILSLTISGAIVVFITICCFFKRRQHSQNDHDRKCNREVENLLLQYGSLAPKRYRYSEIKKTTKSFSDKLGQGGYGSVYKGMLPDGRLVAVKILIEADSNGEEFINEVASFSRTSHVNVVTLLGFCYEGNKRALVYEFMPNKSLDKFLSNNGSADCFLDFKKLYTIAVGIAKGLEYLHTGCNTRIVHFDIKPQNILLDEEFCPKISDFGLAKLCKKQQSVLSVVGTRGTAGYIAPEVFSRNFGGVSHKSDVYSYGMMLLEMAGARKIVEMEVIQSDENYFPDKIYEQVIIDIANNVYGLTIEEEEERKRKMFVVGFWCIQTIPSDRPSISKVVEMLEGNLEAIQIPPKPFLFTSVIPDLQTSDNLSQD